jgi:choline dehydrogenase-like flavoprotein
MTHRYDVIIVGSGAGGSAAAYHLAQTGKRVLLLERGMRLPRDGSTLDPDKVVRHALFVADEPWEDGRGRTVVPQERFNLGGKTKWYGAALLRYGTQEFGPDHGHGCLGFPFGYEELEPFYDEAEALLGVRTFATEPDLQRIVGGLRRRDAGWQRRMLPMGLAPDILSFPEEVRHFDGFASTRGLKSDAETSLLARVSHSPNLTVATGKQVCALEASTAGLDSIRSVRCEDGTRYEGDAIVLAAGALHSPRLLQAYLDTHGLAEELPGYQLVGRYYKYHVLTAMLAVSHRPQNDPLRKTTLLLHEKLPHSSVQPLGWLDGELLAPELPPLVPRWAADLVGRRVYGFFLQTEDGSHPANRVRAGGPGRRPVLDYDLARLPAAAAEHRRLRRLLGRQLASLGYAVLIKRIGAAGTAHACGTLVCGRDPSSSVVDPQGRVHGFENLFVADGSVLARSARVNPALTIYAWGLRVASVISGKETPHERLELAAADPIRS